jgi:hypothetical protein
MLVLSSDNEVPASNQTHRPRRTAKLSSRLTDPNNHATPELRIHQKPGPTASTNTTSQNTGKRNAADSDSDDLQSEHADDEGMAKDKPSRGKLAISLFFLSILHFTTILFFVQQNGCVVHHVHPSRWH